MRHPLFCAAIVAVFSCSATAYALTCHIVLDRTDTVVYRDIVPPVDLSDRGRADRAAMRQRGEFLLMMEADQCSRFIATTGAAGGGGTVEDIVAGLRSYPGAAGGGGVMSSARPSTGPAPATSSAAPTPPAMPAAARSGRGY